MKRYIFNSILLISSLHAYASDLVPSEDASAPASQETDQTPQAAVVATAEPLVEIICKDGQKIQVKASFLTKFKYFLALHQFKQEDIKIEFEARTLILLSDILDARINISDINDYRTLKDIAFLLDYLANDDLLNQTLAQIRKIYFESTPEDQKIITAELGQNENLKRLISQNNKIDLKPEKTINFDHSTTEYGILVCAASDKLIAVHEKRRITRSSIKQSIIIKDIKTEECINRFDIDEKDGKVTKCFISESNKILAILLDSRFLYTLKIFDIEHGTCIGSICRSRDIHDIIISKNCKVISIISLYEGVMIYLLTNIDIKTGKQISEYLTASTANGNNLISLSEDKNFLVSISGSSANLVMNILNMETGELKNINIPNIQRISSIKFIANNKIASISNNLKGINELIIYDLDGNIINRNTLKCGFFVISMAASCDGKIITIISLGLRFEKLHPEKLHLIDGDSLAHLHTFELPTRYNGYNCRTYVISNKFALIYDGHTKAMVVIDIQAKQVLEKSFKADGHEGATQIFRSGENRFIIFSKNQIDLGVQPIQIIDFEDED